MILSEQIARYIDSNGHGIFDLDGTTSTIAVNMLYEDDNSIMVKETGGFNPKSSLGSGILHKKIQIKLRGSDDTIATSEKAIEIYNSLLSFSGKLTPTGDCIIHVQGLQSSPIHIGNDANRHPIMAMNFLFMVQDDNATYN